MTEIWGSMGLPARLLVAALVCVAAYAVTTLLVRASKTSPPEKPGSDVDAKWAGLPEPPAFRLYSERQIVAMTVLFTPLAGGVLLRSNLRRLGEKTKARHAMLYAIAVLAGMLAVCVALSVATAGAAGGGGIGVGFEFGAAASMHWAFKRWLAEPMQAHLAAGGRLASPLRAFAVGVLPAAVIASPFLMLFGFLEYTGCVRVRSSFVCPADQPSRADAREFAASLRKSAAFRGAGAMLVSLGHRTDGLLQADFSLDDSQLKDEQLIGRLNSVASDVIEDAYRDRQVLIFACHEQRNCRSLGRPSRQLPPTPAPSLKLGATALTKAATPVKAVAMSPVRTLSPAQVRDTLMKNRVALQRCVDDALQRDPKLSVGKLHITATVARSGHVEAARIDDSSFDKSELGSCLKQATRAVEFPPFQGDPLDVDIPLVVTRP